MNIALVFIWSYAKFHARSAQGFVDILHVDILQNVKGCNFMPPPAARGLINPRPGRAFSITRPGRGGGVDATPLAFRN